MVQTFENGRSHSINHVLNWTVYERYENQKLDDLLKAVYFELSFCSLSYYNISKRKNGTE